MKNEDDDKMVEFIKKGLSYKEVSDLLDRTPDSIRCRCFRLGVKSSDYKNMDNNKCLECGKEINDTRKTRKFCDRSCSAIFNNKNRTPRIIKKCVNCGNDLNYRSKKYCSQKCQTEFEHNQYIDKWKNGEVDGNIGKYRDSLSVHVRKYIIKKYDSKCSKCGWNEINIYTGKVPLEVDHINGDHLNSVEENLRPLCPSCHSLTEYYGSRNKGRGRRYRQEYRKNKNKLK